VKKSDYILEYDLKNCFEELNIQKTIGIIESYGLPSDVKIEVLVLAWGGEAKLRHPPPFPGLGPGFLDLFLPPQAKQGCPTT